MEARKLFEVLRRWAWLIIACVIVAGGAAYLQTSRMPKSYDGQATLIVGQSLTATNPDYNQLLASQRLSLTYAAIATMGTTLERVIQSLDLPLTPDELRGKVTAEAPRDSTLINIRASDADPVVAAAIANAIANELIAASPAIQGQQADVQAFVARQLEALQLQIQLTQGEVNSLMGVPARSPDQEQRLGAFQERLIQLRSTYTAMLQSSPNSSANLLTLADPAVPPTTPSSPRVLLITLLGALCGLLLAAGFAFLVDYLDDTVKSPEDVAEVAGIPTLGLIARMKPEKGGHKDFATLSDLRAPSSEAFRTLRTNLGFASVDAPLQAILVTSAVPGEGKTTVACNLAVAFAQAGKRVYLVDADLRRPGVHLTFQLPNVMGLSRLLQVAPQSFASLAHEVQENLRVITTGPLPPNPAELLGSQRMSAMLDLLKSDADIVILDSPPLQAVTDAAVLAAIVDGTLLVIDASKTRKRVVGRAREALDLVDARVLGAALNKLTERAGSYYYYQYAQTARRSGDTGTGELPSPATAIPDRATPL